MSRRFPTSKYRDGTSLDIAMQRETKKRARTGTLEGLLSNDSEEDVGLDFSTGWWQADSDANTARTKVVL